MTNNAALEHKMKTKCLSVINRAIREVDWVDSLGASALFGMTGASICGMLGGIGGAIYSITTENPDGITAGGSAAIGASVGLATGILGSLCGVFHQAWQTACSPSKPSKPVLVLIAGGLDNRCD